MRAALAKEINKEGSRDMQRRQADIASGNADAGADAGAVWGQ